MTDEKAAGAIRSLFATRILSDVRLEVQGNVLIVILEERRPSASIDFVGIRNSKRTRSSKGCATSDSRKAGYSTCLGSIRPSRSSNASI